MNDPTERWCRTALSGQAPDRPLSPPDEPLGEEFDYYEDAHYSIVPERIRKPLQNLLVMNAHGIEFVPLQSIREELQSLHEEMKTLFEEEY